MIVDAHLHVWKADPDYPDQAATTVSPACDVPLELLEGYMAEFDVDRAVIVQPVFPGSDNQYVVECARTDPDRFAVVCVVDPTRADAARQLEQWAGETVCRGLRLRPVLPAEERVFGDPASFALWETAARCNLVVSILARDKHIDQIRNLAQQFSSVQIVVDHLAHPPSLAVKDCQNLLSLSDCGNVAVKVSGQPYYSQQRYPYSDCQELFSAVRDRFGADRMMWGSDFPHVLLQSGYARSRFWLERHCPFLSADERRRVMGANAAKLYWSK